MSLQGEAQEVANLKRWPLPFPCVTVSTLTSRLLLQDTRLVQHKPPSLPSGHRHHHHRQQQQQQQQHLPQHMWVRLLTPSPHQQACLSVCFMREDSDLVQMKRLWLKPI